MPNYGSNNGPYMFGVTRASFTDAEGAELEAIARLEEADFIGPVSLPGNDITGWFTCRNYGHPFDAATAAAVMERVERRSPELYARLYPARAGASKGRGPR